jgi:hypothetical protein
MSDAKLFPTRCPVFLTYIAAIVLLLVGRNVSAPGAATAEWAFRSGDHA